jgi:hypothetical protein
MREAFVILLVLLVLLALTAFKYRRQIGTVVGIGRMIRDAAAGGANRREPRIEQPVESGKLVSCTKCGTWVPENRAIKFGGGTFFCTDKCLQSAIKSV